MKKAIIVLVAILVGIGVVGTGGMVFLKKKGTPQYEGKLLLNELSSPVDIQFDVNGIPHIQAKNESDGFRALGYVMAQDRLFQMDLIRRAAKGELSEIFGAKALEADYLFRTLSLTQGIKKQVQLGLMDTKTVKLMESFYKGVNAFIEKGDLSFEFTLLKYKPKRFDMMDGFGVLGYMAYTFAQGFKTDPLMNAVLKAKGEGYTNKLRSQPLPNLIQKTSLVFPPDFHFEDSIWFKGYNFVEKTVGLFEGSNAWALSSKRSQDGQPILAGDPHVSFTLPGLWYEAHIKWPTDKKENFEWYGHFVPGLPFAAMGHGPKHGWAVTISYIDDMDFIKVDDSHPIEERVEVIKVKGEKDKTLKVRTSPFGPLIQDILKPHLRSPKEKVAMKWGHHDPKNLSAKAFYGAMMANNKEEFEQALALGKSPGLNIIYADTEGNIARYLFGEYWKRPRNMSGDIFYPSYRTDLVELPSVDFFDRPHLINPESGVVVSANQKPEGVPELKAGYFQPMDRYRTIHEILKGKEKWNIQELKYVQTAPVNILFKEYQSRIVESVKLQVKKGSRNVKALEIFEKWDGLSPHSSAGALIFYKFMKKFQAEYFSDLDASEFDAYCNTNNGWHVLTRILLNKSEQGKVFKAFSAAVKELHEKHGGPANWAFGNEHTLTFSHPLSRAGAALAFFLDIGPEPMDGGHTQINNMRTVGCKDGLKVKAGPSSRRLISFSDPKESLGILPLGNSGHYESPFFSNQWEKYRNGEYRAQWMRPLKGEEVKYSLSLLPSK